jgi:hypothetical protein
LLRSRSLSLLFLLLFTTTTLAADPLSTTPVGLEGKVLFRSSDPALRPLPVDDKSDLTLRIADKTPDGAAFLYDLRFITFAPGDYDLRAYLQHPDGSKVTDGQPVMVRSTASLPASANNDLFPIGATAAPRLGGYRLTLIALGVLWSLPIVWLIYKRLTRKKHIEALPPSPPTLADQLRPLVEAAMSGAMGPAEQARLERLLVAHWRDRLHLIARSHNESLHTLRNHEEAGPLLAHLEQWLHQPASTPAAKPTTDITVLLAPYREAAPIDLPTHLNGSSHTTGGRA